MRLLLCSASPRRRDFLAGLGISFEISHPNIDETKRQGETAMAYVARMAMEKATACARPGYAAMAADTVVVMGEEVLGKPRDRADAERMLRMLSGAEHRVISCVGIPGVHAYVVITFVRFAKLSDAQIRWLVDSGEGDDKAGAYAAQGLAGSFIERIEGSVSNVVGLPMAETLRLLEQAGVEMPWKG